MKNLLDLLLRKIKEPSTWTGLTALLGAVGIYVSPELIAAISSIVLGVIGAIEVWKKEN